MTTAIFVVFPTAAGDAGAKLWNAESGQSTKSYAGSTDFLYAVAVSDDGKIVATGGQGQLIVKASRFVKIYDEDLTLHGLRLIWRRCANP